MTNRNKAVIWVLAVFLLGALSGGGLTYLLIPAAVRGPDGKARTARQHEDPFERLARDLKLTAEQKVDVRRILDEARRDTEKRFSEVRALADKRMKEALTPEQFAIWEKRMKELQEHRRRHDRGAPEGPEQKPAPKP
jgi:Spy/CpxP family protein refolding chaperone